MRGAVNEKSSPGSGGFGLQDEIALADLEGDVVVVNFLNQTNEADQHVFRLLSEKFQLFEGVFGASDEVLGAIESGVDFEKRIADSYQR